MTKAFATPKTLGWQQLPALDGMIFGGSFDPIHQGHLDCMHQALCVFPQSRLLLVPAKSPAGAGGVHKTPGLGFDERLDLCAQSLAYMPEHLRDRVELCDIERNLPTPNYTFHTLSVLQAERPGCRWAMLLGADQWVSFYAWRHPIEILQRCSLIVLNRPPWDSSVGLKNLETLLHGLRLEPWENGRGYQTPWDTWILNIDVSISQAASRVIRGCLGEGELPPPQWLPLPLQEYVLQRKFYR